MRGAFLHMLADAGVSVAVIVAAGGIMATGWQWLDPAASLLISVVILVGCWRLLREALRLTLAAVPEKIDPRRWRAILRDLPEVDDLHDLHIWAMSTTETALTCHLVTPRGHPGDAFLQRVGHDCSTSSRSATSRCRSSSATAANARCEARSGVRADGAVVELVIGREG